jgi:rubrerythrin
MSDHECCQRLLDGASTAEAHNSIRLLHLADVADGMGDPELAARLRVQAGEEQLHAWHLYELAAAADVDLVTDERLESPTDVLHAALAYARCQAEETSPSYADQARRLGCEEVAAVFRRHAEACRGQVAALEALATRAPA